MESVKLVEVVKKMKFELLTPNVDFSETEIRQCDINRPALQLTGYFEHDDAHADHRHGGIFLHVAHDAETKGHTLPEAP